MNLISLIIISLIGLVIIFFIIRLINHHFSVSKNNHNQTVQPNQKISLIGEYKVDVTGQQQLELGFGESAWHVAAHRYQLERQQAAQAPQDNRYSYYDFYVDPQHSTDTHPLSLNLALQHGFMQFEHINKISIGRRDDAIVMMEFEMLWTDKTATPQQAYMDFKAQIQYLYSLGFKNYYALDEVRYRQQDYARVLKEKGHCIAPEYLTFQQFSDDFIGKDYYGSIYLYVDNIVMDILYDANASAMVEIFKMDDMDAHLSEFGMDDMEIASLSDAEKRIKFEHYVDCMLMERKKEEALAKASNYMIDEMYPDPYQNL